MQKVSRFFTGIPPHKYTWCNWSPNKNSATMASRITQNIVFLRFLTRRLLIESIRTLEVKYRYWLSIHASSTQRDWTECRSPRVVE